MKRWLVRALGVALLLAVGGFLVSASGLISIAASSGHWAVTRWVLEFSMRRSISTHSLGVKAPPLDNRGLILKGAGSYAIACSACHGSPDRPHPRVAAGLTPRPPYLGNTAATWDSEELFTIIKHGIKFTGMPAWPAQQRDDEVWAVVAFVRALPRLTAEEYQELAYGSGPEPENVSAAPAEELNPPPGIHQVVTTSCVRCHGRGGNGRGQPAFPHLAGQREAYLLASLDALARGERHSGIMEPVAYGLDAAKRQELARYYAGLPAPAPAGAGGHPAAIERGRVIAHRGDASKRLPSCVDCHGPEGKRRRPVYPDLRGQPADYLVRQLELFKDQRRGGTEFAHLMHHVAPHLSAEQMHDVAAYFASIPAEPERSAGVSDGSADVAPGGH